MLVCSVRLSVYCLLEFKTQFLCTVMSVTNAKHALCYTYKHTINRIEQQQKFQNKRKKKKKKTKRKQFFDIKLFENNTQKHTHTIKAA